MYYGSWRKARGGGSIDFKFQIATGALLRRGRED
jgi:hypothetical protein